MHAFGRGVRQNYVDAALLLQRCLRLDPKHSGAAYYLGVMHAHGQGMPTNYEVARAYFQQAVDGSDDIVRPDARAALAELSSAIALAQANADVHLNQLARAVGRDTL